MASVTIHTDTTEQEECKVRVVTVAETGRQFIICEIAQVSLFISNRTALALKDALLNVIKEVIKATCLRHDLELDENHECLSCVKEDIEHYNNHGEHRNATI